jgi:hypothetical protein
VSASPSRVKAAIDRAHTVHGRRATFTHHATDVEVPLTALLRIDATGIGALIALKAEDLATAPVKHDFLVFEGASDAWYVDVVTDGRALRGDYRLECRSNRPE